MARSYYQQQYDAALEQINKDMQDPTRWVDQYNNSQVDLSTYNPLSGTAPTTTNSEGMTVVDPNWVASRASTLSQSDGKKALMNQDLKDWQSQLQSQKGYWDTHTMPESMTSNGWLDNFMEKVFPAIILTTMAAGAGSALVGGTAAGAGGAGAAGSVEGLGSLAAVDAGVTGTTLADLAASGALETGLGAGAGTAAAGAGGAGLAGLGAAEAGAAAAIPSVTISAPAAAAVGGGISAGTAAGVAAGVGGLAGISDGAAANNGGSGEDTTPAEFSDENVTKNATDSLNQGTDTAIKNATTTPSSTLQDLLNIGKNINSVVGAFQDKGNNQNTANNANGQLANINAQMVKDQATRDAYIKQLTDAANSTSASNKDYLAALNGQLSSIDKNQSAYESAIQAQVGKNTASNAAYVDKLNGLSTSQIDADNAYMAKLMGMYMPGTSEATLLENKMNAKDAAAGRNSQYGVRSIDLAGQLASLRGQLMTSSAYQAAQQHNSAYGLITGGGYLNAMNNTSSTDLLNNQSYQNSINNKPQTDLLTSQAYQNSVNNTAANNILTSGAMSGTVNNNNATLAALLSPGYTGLNQTATNATNNQNNSLFGTAANLLSNGASIYNSGKNIWSGLSSLF